jgi:hypothetical protein
MRKSFNLCFDITGMAGSWEARKSAYSGAKG